MTDEPELEIRTIIPHPDLEGDDAGEVFEGALQLLYDVTQSLPYRGINKQFDRLIAHWRECPNCRASKPNYVERQEVLRAIIKQVEDLGHSLEAFREQQEPSDNEPLGARSGHGSTNLH